MPQPARLPIGMDIGDKKSASRCTPSGGPAPPPGQARPPRPTTSGSAPGPPGSAGGPDQVPSFIPPPSLPCS